MQTVGRVRARAGDGRARLCRREENAIESDADWFRKPQVLDRCRANGGEMILAEVRSGPLRPLLAAGKLQKFGRRNIAQSMTSAMQRARILVEERRGVIADQRG